MTNHFHQTAEKIGEKKTTSILSSGLGTGKLQGQCCSEVRVHSTHGRKEARPHEETKPKERFLSFKDREEQILSKGQP